MVGQGGSKPSWDEATQSDGVARRWGLLLGATAWGEELGEKWGPRVAVKFRT